MAKQNKSNENAAVIMAKTMNFLKHNVYYILMGVCILALATVITVAAVVNSNKPNNEVDVNAKTPAGQVDSNDQKEEEPKDVEKEQEEQNEKPAIAEQFYIVTPLENCQIEKEFTNTELVYNLTQNQWTTHEGVDFKAKAGSEVRCVYDGVVEDIQTNSFYGTVVTIKHKDGYTSIYKLLDDVNLKVGNNIKKNEKIGVVSGEALAEISDGPHLHFELLKDGKKINPMDYFITGNK